MSRTSRPAAPRHPVDARRPARTKMACMALGCCVALTAAVALPRDVHAADVLTTGQWVGACAFSPPVAEPPLQATFAPDLTSLTGSGECVGSDGVVEQITLQLSGGGGLSCLGGLETMSGRVGFDGPSPGNQPSVTASAAGAPGLIHLVILAAGFSASADLAWPDTGCPGSFTTSLSGALAYQSS